MLYVSSTGKTKETKMENGKASQAIFCMYFPEYMCSSFASMHSMSSPL